MAQTTVYTCDICKQSKSKDDLAKITVKSEGIRMKGVGYSGIVIDICNDCLNAESLSKETLKRIDMPCQLILLKVTEDSALKVEVG